MLRLGKGKIVTYECHRENRILKVGVLQSGDFWRYVDLDKLKCGRTMSWHTSVCDMYCLLDGAGTLYYSKVEPQFYA